MRTRSNIAKAVGALAHYIAGLMEAHWQAALGIVRYLAGTANDGVTFGRSEETLVGCDADYAREHSIVEEGRSSAPNLEAA